MVHEVMSVVLHSEKDSDREEEEEEEQEEREHTISAEEIAQLADKCACAFPSDHWGGRSVFGLLTNKRVSGDLASVLRARLRLYVIDRQGLDRFVSPSLVHLGLYCD